jgi:pantetheine-phosphate adenylyltransferase
LPFFPPKPILPAVPNSRIAIYAGSFDPITRGHEDLMHRSLEYVDRLIVAVASNSSKQPLFSIDERVELIRGLRAVSDFEYEYQMALMNRHLSPRLETVFMVPSLDTTYISASLVREVARYGGEVGDLVHPRVAEALRTKIVAR